MIIQKVAPGPPNVIANATPAILPRPTVPETAVVKAWKWLTSPSLLSSLIVSGISPSIAKSVFSVPSSNSSYLPLTVLIAVGKCLIFTKENRIVKKRAPKIKSNKTIGISINELPDLLISSPVYTNHLSGFGDFPKPK